MIVEILGLRKRYIFVLPPVHSGETPNMDTFYALFCKLAWYFLTKFCHSDQRFNRILFSPLCLKFETSGHAQLVNIYRLQICRRGVSWKLSIDDIMIVVI